MISLTDMPSLPPAAEVAGGAAAAAEDAGGAAAAAEDAGGAAAAALATGEALLLMRPSAGFFF